jgi:hypothetical protein
MLMEETSWCRQVVLAGAAFHVTVQNGNAPYCGMVRCQSAPARQN